MKRGFIFEVVTGAVLLTAVLIFGHKGFAAFALFAFYPFIIKKRNKLDERESQLLNKTGRITAGATFLASVIIYFLSDVVLNGETIVANWLFYVCAAFLLSHGISGLIVFLTNKFRTVRLKYPINPNSGY